MTCCAVGVVKRTSACLLIAVGACLGAAVSASAQLEIAWSTAGRAYRGTGEPVPLTCPPDGFARAVWGTATYTDDSSICTAAVHAGLITFREGGPIVLRMRPGLGSYTGSSRNGVTSESWQQWEASFSVSEYIAPAAPPPPGPPAPPPTIAWDRTAAGLAPNGRRFTFTCRPAGKAAPVIGADLFSWDSSICGAAVHAGAITVAKGGVVTIEMRPGRDTYGGSVRNGVASMPGAATILGFVVVGREM